VQKGREKGGTTWSTSRRRHGSSAKKKRDRSVAVYNQDTENCVKGDGWEKGGRIEAADIGKAAFKAGEGKVQS